MSKPTKLKPKKLKSKLILSLLSLGLILSATGWGVYSYYQNQQAKAATLTATSISPNQGYATGGQTVVIDGDGFMKEVAFTQISAGFGHACAIASDDKTYCWGSNYSGQLGDGGTNIRQDTPVAVSLPTDVTFSCIAAGASHTCALGSDSRAYCWGDNYKGQLGSGLDGGNEILFDAGIDSKIPAAVQMPVGVVFSQIVAGGDFTCALDSDNRAHCWGSDSPDS